MEWVDAVSAAIQYIESHITQDIRVEEVAKQVGYSPFYFQKGFSMLCGLSVSEYIRNRRLALAGSELASTDVKIIDLALKYGYESPDSFTKAFVRFHGVTPSMVQKDGMTVKSFSPLKLTITMKGGYLMDYKIMKKDAFTVLAASKMFKYENCKQEIPLFWQQHYQNGNGKYVCGCYGISIDEAMNGSEFEYLIADNYNPAQEVPQGLITKTIPAFTWAVFPCKGALPKALQTINTQIYSEWLPGMKEYEVAAGYCVEMYNDPTSYPKGTGDENYYCEMWIPVKKIEK